MKYLENLEFEKITNFLTKHALTSGRIINGKIELYSTKRAGDDKKQSKLLEQKLGDVESNKSIVKLSIDLIQTLNASLVDYDFNELTVESFKPMNINTLVKNINMNLAELTAEKPSFLTELWCHIDKAVTLSNCEGYALIDDPFTNDTEIIWSFLYFFVNKDLKRVCLFACNAITCNHKDISTFLLNDLDDDDDYDIESENLESDKDCGSDNDMEVSSQEM